MTGWLLGLALAMAAAPPSDHTIVYYNARMALRDGDATEALKLWLLRNAMEDRTGRVSPYDADFHSVTWAALGDLGLCPDGYPDDKDGAGLWPLALHNWVVRNLGRQARLRGANPFKAFEVGRQSRFVTASDVLTAGELADVQFARGRCLRPRLALLAAGEDVTARLSDRQVDARLMRFLLERAKTTLATDRVRGRSVIEARLFDLDLQLASLAEREARLQARNLASHGRQVGLSPASVAALRAEAPTSTLDPDSPAAGVLRASETWPADEWMALSPDRRLYLFEAARNYVADHAAFQVLGLAILDRMIAAGDGAGVAQWVGLLAPDDGDAGAREAIWSGPRGEQLLALDPASGFGERSVIALQRGIDQLASGDLPAALRSMAFARQHSSESQASAALDGLTLRWLGYVTAQFAITGELLDTLAELVPRRDYSVLLENLLWSAALHADLRSFQTGLDKQVGHGALERRLALLRPLAGGDTKRFLAQIRAGLTDSQAETLRFLNQLMQHLELEDGDVRAAQLPTLRGLRALLEPLASDQAGRPGRDAAALVDRALAIEQGISGLPPGASARDRARALSPDDEVFAGSVRLAPADPLPWPFHAAVATAPSVFTPIELRPEEWTNPDGKLVFGWSIHG